MNYELIADINGVLLLVFLLVFLLVVIRKNLQIAFYRSYFQQKQKNQGKDPDEVLRVEFGKAWRWIR